MEKTETRRLPVHGFIGFGLIAVFWFLNWFLPGTRTSWGFFPLWLGYSLAVDSLVYHRKGNSLLTRNPAVWAGLFFVSAPVWWLFELLNLRMQNWLYLGVERFSTIQYAFLSTWSFSTVMPAVFGTAELVRTWKPIEKFVSGPGIPETPVFLKGLLTAGVFMLTIMLIWPKIFFPLLWISLWCILEALNKMIGNRSLLDDLFRGDWRRPFSLALGCLICGFFWEMWNFYSYPQWVYRIPYADWFHIFEMPLAGYLGYIPFSLELFAVYNLLTWPFRNEKKRSGILPEE
jgi:hypothetical protein